MVTFPSSSAAASLLVSVDLTPYCTRTVLIALCFTHLSDRSLQPEFAPSFGIIRRHCMRVWLCALNWFFLLLTSRSNVSILQITTVNSSVGHSSNMTMIPSGNSKVAKVKGHSPMWQQSHTFIIQLASSLPWPKSHEVKVSLYKLFHMVLYGNAHVAKPIVAVNPTW